MSAKCRAFFKLKSCLWWRLDSEHQCHQDLQGSHKTCKHIVYVFGHVPNLLCLNVLLHAQPSLSLGARKNLEPWNVFYMKDISPKMQATTSCIASSVNCEHVLLLARFAVWFCCLAIVSCCLLVIRLIVILGLQLRQDTMWICPKPQMVAPPLWVTDVGMAEVLQCHPYHMLVWASMQACSHISGDLLHLFCGL